jgi:intracellular septation protein A
VQDFGNDEYILNFNMKIINYVYSLEHIGTYYDKGNIKKIFLRNIKLPIYNFYNFNNEFDLFFNF